MRERLLRIIKWNLAIIMVILCTYVNPVNAEDNVKAINPWNGSSDTSWYTENTKQIMINKPEQLAGFAQLVNAGNTFAGKKILLETDLFFNESESQEKIWEPIASIASNVSFEGTFDGQGHTLYNLYICTEGGALFGRIGEKGIVKAVDISQGYIEGVASIACENKGQILFCENNSFITEYSNEGMHELGGICSENGNLVYGCGNIGTVERFFSGAAGGIVGWNLSEGTIDSCWNHGEVAGNTSGGIAGENSSGWISDCYNAGSIGGYRSAGILGDQSGGMSSYRAHIYNCYNIGSVSGDEIFLDKYNGEELCENVYSFSSTKNVCGAIEVTTEELKSTEMIKRLQGENVIVRWGTDEGNLNDGYVTTIAQQDKKKGVYKMLPDIWGGIQEKTIYISEGDYQLKAFQYAYYGRDEATAIYSSNSDIISITSKGMITPLKEGTAKIHVEFPESEYRKKCGFDVKVTVEKEPEKVILGNIEDADITVKDRVYTGYSVTTEISVKLNDIILSQGSDYSVEYSNNTDIGTATVVLSGIGDYIGTVTKTFEIVQPQIKGMTVQYHTQDEIRAYLKNHPINKDKADVYEIKPSTKVPYKPGKLTKATQNNALAAFNFMRYIAGIDANVKLDEEYCKAAQAGTMLNSINGQLTHYPDRPKGISDELYELGYKGTSSSNLGLGYRNLIDSIVSGWMSDSDDSNIDRIGHRRWILNPSIRKTGFGSCGGYTAVYALDNSFGDSPYTPYYGVAWPAQNAPIEYFRQNDAWNISIGENIMEEKVKVTLTRKKDNKKWLFSYRKADGYFNVNNQGYGQNGCIIFRPNNMESYKPGDKFHVEIEGLSKPISYDVNFFDLEHTMKKTVTKATLEKNGKVVNKCVECGKVTSTKVIPHPKTIKLSTTNYTYTGSMKKPSVIVKDSEGKAISSDYYTVSYASGRKYVGRYSVKVTFKGNYKGSKTFYFEIGPKNPSTVSATLYGYDDVKVSWSKVSGVSGYKVYYKKSISGSYTYLGRTSRTYTYKKNLTDGAKYYFKVVAYKTINDNRCENAGKTDYIYTLKKVSTPRLSKSGTKVKVRWTNISGESGYQISRSTSKTGTSIVSTYKTTSGTYKTLTATKGKYYYYKVRAYKTVGSKKVYGPWSTAVRYKR